MGDIFDWNGGDGAFGDQNQWTDISTDPPQDPAQRPPGSGDFTVFQSGGTVSGDGNVQEVQVTGAAVTFTGNITTADAFFFGEASSVQVQGGALTPSTGGVVVGSSSSLIVNGGSINVGTAAVGVESGSSVTLESGGVISGGDVGVQSGSDLHVESGASIDLSAGAGNFQVGLPGNASATFELDSGGTVSDQVGIVDASATIAGEWSTTGGLVVGLFNAGTLLINGGTVTTDMGAGTAFAVGVLSGDSGTVSVTSGTLVANGDTNVVGGQGSGTLDIESGGSVDVAGTLDLGVMSGGTGTLTVNGGMLSVGKAFIVGDTGAAVAMIGSDGSASVSDALTIGASDGGSGTVSLSGTGAAASLGSLTVGNSGTASLSLDGGAELDTSSDVTIGASGGSKGTVSVSDVGTLLNDGGTLTIGEAGAGELDINQGSVDVFNGVVTLGVSASSSGSLSLGQSSLNLSGSLLIGGAGSGAMEVAAGGKLNAADITLGAITNGSGNLQIDGSGASAQSSNMTVGLNGTGQLEVSAKGTLATTGQAVLGVGALPVTQQQANVLGGGLWTVGTLLDIGEAANAILSIASGGKVSAGSVVLGDLASASGTVTADGTLGSALSSLLTGNLTVGNNGTGDVALTNHASLNVGGTLAIGGHGTLAIASGATVQANSAIISGGGSIALSGGEMIVSGSVSGAGTLAFGGVATFVLGSPGGGLGVPVTGLDAGDVIELGGMSIKSASVTSPGTVTVVTSGSPYLLTDVGFASGAPQTFQVGSDSKTGDDFIKVACFVTGTRIGTRRGDVAVEELRVGDMVRVVPHASHPHSSPSLSSLPQRGREERGIEYGAVQPIVFIRRRRIDCARHPRPERVWPVRVAAHAFGRGKPKRDLWLSPDHAVFRDGVLIPVKYLIDDERVVQIAVARIEYWHVELPRHDVLLAEGLAAESYLDTGDAHPDIVWEAFGCAPLVVGSAALQKR